LLVVCAAVTVGYWLSDQHLRGVARTVSLMRLYDQQTDAAGTMLRRPCRWRASRRCFRIWL